MDAEREELHRLVDELPAEQVPGALAALRGKAEKRPVAPWPPAWFGSVQGSARDTAERADEILREGLGRRPA